METGQFAVLQRQLSGVSRDRRIQALLIAFSFGAFIEGAAGFGTPVAISGALMIGLGFRPLEAAKLALIGNTAPVAFGALGIPLVTLAKVTNLDLGLLSAMVGRQLSLFAVLIPFWLVVVQAGWRGMIAVWPACLVAGVSFGLTEFLVSNYHGPWLAGVASAIVSMAALVLLMKFWRPAEEQPAGARETTHIKFGVPPSGGPAAKQPAGAREAPAGRLPAGQDGPAWKAWLPWMFLTVFVFLWGLPEVKKFLDSLFSKSFEMPGLHNLVLRVPPVVAQPTKEPPSLPSPCFRRPARPCCWPASSPASAFDSARDDCWIFMRALSGVSAFPC